jgi:hypothetical protein
MKRHSWRVRLGSTLAIIVAVTGTVIVGSAVPAAADVGPYMVINYDNAQCADVYLGRSNDGASVLPQTCEHYSEQLWTIRPDGDAFEFVNYRTDKCLDIPRYLFGGEAMQNTCTNSATQQWRYTSSPTGPLVLPQPGNHVYQFLNVRSNLCLQFHAYGYPLFQTTCNGQSSQLWVVSS